MEVMYKYWKMSNGIGLSVAWGGPLRQILLMVEVDTGCMGLGGLAEGCCWSHFLDEICGMND